jgi:hypothetical protein
MYKLRYYNSFKDINENTIKVEVYIDTDNTVKAEELVSSADPVSIQYSGDEDIFQPFKLSGASINFLVKNVLSDLYTGELKKIRVHILKNDELIWIGYQTPNIYSQPYLNEYDELTIECVDTLSIGENVEYKYIGTETKISTFSEIILHILNMLDPEKVIKDLYIHNTNSIENDFNLLDRYSIQERNFFDEEEEPQKVKEVLEDIMRYLGLTLFQWKDSYYAIDPSALSTISSFSKYSRETGECVSVNLDITSRNLLDIGIGEGNGSISLGDVFNKVSVIANTNGIDSLIPDAVEDDVDIVNQNINPNKIWETTNTIYEDLNNKKDTKKDYTMLSGYFKSLNNWSYFTPYKLVNYVAENIDEVTLSNIDDIQMGVVWQKTADYLTEEEPSSLDWKSTLSFIMEDGNYMDNLYYQMFSLKKQPLQMFKGGYFIIDMTYRMSQHKKANTVLNEQSYHTYDRKYINEVFSNSKYGTGFQNTRIPCHLDIGDYFFDGDDWVSYEDYNLKVERGYYKNVTGPVYGYDDAKWYKIKDEYGYWRYVNKATYNSSYAPEKQTGNCGSGRKYLIADDTTTDGIYGDDTIWIEESYYYECALMDNFYLEHKNKEGDQVFGVERKLTNTVSWRMGLANSDDGVAIPLPKDKVLSGKINFKLYTPNHLGRMPMHLNSVQSQICKAFHITELILRYTSADTVKNTYTGEQYESDILYSNDINESFVNEFDDVTLRVNSYNPKATSYSYVLDNTKQDFVDKVMNSVTGTEAKPEEHLIQKYVDHYSSPKIKYENTVLDKNITPFSIIREETLNKEMITNSLTYNLEQGNVNIELTEL